MKLLINETADSFPGPAHQKVAPMDPGLEMPKCDFEPELYQVIKK